MHRSWAPYSFLALCIVAKPCFFLLVVGTWIFLEVPFSRSLCSMDNAEDWKDEDINTSYDIASPPYGIPNSKMTSNCIANKKQGGEAYAQPLLEWLQKPLEHLHGHKAKKHWLRILAERKTGRVK